MSGTLKQMTPVYETATLLCDWMGATFTSEFHAQATWLPLMRYTSSAFGDHNKLLFVLWRVMRL